MKTSNLSADNFKKVLDLDGLTPEPAIWSGDTGQRIPCFDSCQLITILMCNQFPPGLPGFSSLDVGVGLFILKSRRNHYSYVGLLPKLYVYFQHNMRSCHIDSNYCHNSADQAVRAAKFTFFDYRIYSNKRRGGCFENFRTLNAAVIEGLLFFFFFQSWTRERIVLTTVPLFSELK